MWGGSVLWVYKLCATLLEIFTFDTAMPLKATGYWLFVLDMRNHATVLSGEGLQIRELQYLGANIWPELSVVVQERYKSRAKSINACKGVIKSPLFITEADFIYLSTKMGVSHVWDVNFSSKLIRKKSLESPSHSH